MSEIANTYAEALFTLAHDEGLDTPIYTQLNVLRQAFAQEPDFLRLLGNPALPKEERCRILDNSFRDQVQPYVLNFLKILTEKGYIRHFDRCCQAYRDRYNQAHDILPVTATTALPLSQDQQTRLTRKLASLTGKTVELTNRVDPTVLGGIRLDYDGMQVDGTVRSRMDAIGKLLKNTVL